MMYLVRWLLVTAVALSLLPSVHAGNVIAGIKARGALRCGVSEGIPGFSERAASGRWTGLDVDFCRAVAAAVFGDAEKTEFVPLKASARFPALQSGRIDLLTRNTSWTFVRETAFNVQFPAVLFFDGQGFMVPKAANIVSVADLKGATVCVEKGTTHIANLAEFVQERGLLLTPLVLDSTHEIGAAFFAGRCQAYTSDASQLAALRLLAPAESGGQGAFVILPERISKEPLAPVVSGGDTQWASLVRWVLFTLILAEENGITQANVAEKWPEIKQQKIKFWKLAGGTEANYGYLIGATDDMGLGVISAVGNYGEMYERNVGRDSPLKIERGLNRLWNDGGLMYAPPID
jgi:general L-amino acid transport system substrate-binding protein